MILKAVDIARLIGKGEKPGARDPLVISPNPDLIKMAKSGSASVDLHLGTWFVTLQQARMAAIRVGESEAQSQLASTHYVPFGREYFIHPRTFVLGITLEWLRLPNNLSAFVIGKSSWGRRGLIIATATGVHPGFKGCLCLELSNVGEMPIGIKPGIEICQIFIQEVKKTDSKYVDQSQFVGSRKPRLGKISLDDIAEKLEQARKEDA
jgi:dCTP deaminase